VEKNQLKATKERHAELVEAALLCRVNELLWRQRCFDKLRMTGYF